MATTQFVDFIRGVYCQHTCITDSKGNLLLYPANQMDTVIKARRETDESWILNCYQPDMDDVYVENWSFNGNEGRWEKDAV